MGEFFHTVFVVPILNILVAFYSFFISLGLPGAFGFAIIGITILIRVVLYPFFKQQLETARKMQDIKPHLDDLQKKHKGDKQALQKEQLKLYQKAGINPAAGCLFALIQIPVFISLYRTLQLFLDTDTEGKVVQQINDDLYFAFLKIQSIDPSFFGLNLALSPSQTGNVLYLFVPLITGALQYAQTRITMPSAPKKKEEKDENGKEKEKSTSEEFQKAMTTQMKYFFPVMIGYLSYTFPLGLSLYWNIFSLFSIFQHFHINRNRKDGPLISFTAEDQEEASESTEEEKDTKQLESKSSKSDKKAASASSGKATASGLTESASGKTKSASQGKSGKKKGKKKKKK